MMKPCRVVIQKWGDDNSAGFHWSWEVWVSRRKDGTFSVGAKQIVRTLFRDPDDPLPHRVSARCRLKTGADVLAAIEGIIEETGYSFPKENPSTIKEVADKLTVLDPKCSEEFRFAAMA
jgi:hypothetical protein